MMTIPETVAVKMGGLSIPGAEMLLELLHRACFLCNEVAVGGIDLDAWNINTAKRAVAELELRGFIEVLNPDDEFIDLTLRILDI